MKYRCLILDHDDTVVESTASIHYPSFMQALKILRPGTTMTVEDYFRYGSDPGFFAMCYDILHFTPEEMDYQSRYWQAYVAEHLPTAYPGMKEFLTRYCARGGTICVISHSLKANILRDYAANGLPVPRLVFGWDVPPEHRKPYPWPLEETLRRLSLAPEEALMVDDLLPGKRMADLCGVPFAAAGWAHSIPEIAGPMKRECRYYCPSVASLAKLVLEEDS